jgi:hypothetical protein
VALRYGDRAPLTKREVDRLEWFMRQAESYPRFRSLVRNAVYCTVPDRTCIWDQNHGIVYDCGHVFVIPKSAVFAGKPIELGPDCDRQTDNVWFTDEHEQQVELLQLELDPIDSKVFGVVWPLPGPWNPVVRRMLYDCELSFRMFRSGVRNEQTALAIRATQIVEGPRK